LNALPLLEKVLGKRSISTHQVRLQGYEGAVKRATGEGSEGNEMPEKGAKGPIALSLCRKPCNFILLPYFTGFREKTL